MREVPKLDGIVEGLQALAASDGQNAKQERAAEALKQFRRQQNLAGEDGRASTAATAAALSRHGRTR